MQGFGNGNWSPVIDSRVNLDGCEVLKCMQGFGDGHRISALDGRGLVGSQ